jgi:hypothetical protein
MDYSYIDKISGSEYASFLRFLVMTMKKDLAVELRDNANDKIFKCKIVDFSIHYETDREGESDRLDLNIMVEGEEGHQALNFLNTGKDKVSKDTNNGPRTFYRYYVYGDNHKGYRFTFNRRVTKK